MESLRMSTRLLSGARLPASYPDKTVRRLSVCTQCHTFGGQTRLSRRPTALPRRSRECVPQVQYSTVKDKRRRFASHEPTKTVDIHREPYGNNSTGANTRREQPIDTEDTTEYIKHGQTPGAFHPVFLRDACPCPKCIDSSSRQKNFQTSDIPETIKAASVESQENGDLTVTWENDIPGFGPDHTSTYPANLLEVFDKLKVKLHDRSENHLPRLWDGNRISEELQYINYDDYMKDDKHLFRALVLLNAYGLLIIRGVPKSEESVADIAGRIGTIRDTFYGRTWDVKSVAQAKNVAYTHQYLGLHMDLLYMTNPPGIQLLHCLQNSCEGGASLFSDSFNAARSLEQQDFETLSRSKLAYHYRNAGEHYYYERPVIEINKNRKIVTSRGASQSVKFINYSPPFQANIPMLKKQQQYQFPRLAKALRNFAGLVESPDNLYEYRLQEGECVIFNNRRVLHGRRQFEAGVGERWLKGTYVDTDVFNSKWRVLNERFKDLAMGGREGEAARFLNGERKVVADRRLENQDATFVNEEERSRIQDARKIRDAEMIEAKMMLDPRVIQEDDRLDGSGPGEGKTV